jgi:hypothetical protein
MSVIDVHWPTTMNRVDSHVWMRDGDLFIGNTKLPAKVTHAWVGSIQERFPPWSLTLRVGWHTESSSTHYHDIDLGPQKGPDILNPRTPWENYTSEAERKALIAAMELSA